ncbi:hypothetical protein G6F59_018596 [Rhizopus arrhizus]|nr:hypothetical protein G6F59_018596 [Rhizopus arrhizus]
MTTAVVPSTTAVGVYIRVSGLSISPSPCSTAFTTPALPSATIQPAARTTLPTISGNTSRITNRLLYRLCVRARKYATGKPSTSASTVHSPATHKVVKKMSR